jgi:hypothetical protein
MTVTRVTPRLGTAQIAAWFSASDAYKFAFSASALEIEYPRGAAKARRYHAT